MLELNPATWPLLLKMCFLLGPFFVMFVGMGMITYMACRDLDRVLGGFSQSQIITSYAESWKGGSLVARYTVMSIVISAVLWPGMHLRRGHLNADELNRVPIPIKRRMQVSAGLLIFGFIWFAGFFVLVHLFE
ncbi:hypothetical protein [Pseudomonas silesiensis]|uniref:hypothetical protein n=1 Tax=Pseudomonas silesiensis TaxID=1853130 RepID=UPI0030D9171C